MAANRTLNFNTNYFPVHVKTFPSKNIQDHDLQVHMAWSPTLFSHFWQRAGSRGWSASYQRASKSCRVPRIKKVGTILQFQLTRSISIIAHFVN